MNEDMNVRQTLEGFREKLQDRIKARIARPSVSDSLQEKNKEQAEKKSPLFAEFKTDKATYIFMAVSAVFTAILGLILGLAPELQTQADGSTVIHFHTDFIHVMIAIIYASAFVSVTEIAFLIAKNKFHTREEGNFWQSASMIVMMIFAMISVIGTGYAGGVIGASVLGFLTEYRNIPPNAQEWVVKIVPVLLAGYAGLLAIYKLTSEEEKEKRLTDQLERKQRREHNLNRKLAELEVSEMLALAEDKAWVEAVERGALTAGDVAGARRAGKSLQDLERERGEDLDGNGFVGGGSGSSSTRPLLVPPGRPWNCVQCGTSNPSRAQFCSGCGASAATNDTVPLKQPIVSGKNGANFQ